ncbi:MAG: 30S ribosomal protein S9 [Lentisphaeria bacterium]|jgi:small subunit ribosomal protein S9|nr:30S ribosomal protein S9 [Lentisphaeria bacterium]
MADDKNVIISIGRRKSASARVRMQAGSGKIKVNKREFEDYFTTESVRSYVMQPLALTGSEANFDFFVNVQGGGLIGQAGALRHGIARALEKNDESLRAVLKPAGMLTRDAREKERKKPGQPGARKRFQFSKR